MNLCKIIYRWTCNPSKSSKLGMRAMTHWTQPETEPCMTCIRQLLAVQKGFHSRLDLSSSVGWISKIHVRSNVWPSLRRSPCLIDKCTQSGWAMIRKRYRIGWRDMRQGHRTYHSSPQIQQGTLPLAPKLRACNGTKACALCLAVIGCITLAC